MFSYFRTSIAKSTVLELSGKLGLSMIIISIGIFSIVRSKSLDMVIDNTTYYSISKAQKFEFIIDSSIRIKDFVKNNIEQNINNNPINNPLSNLIKVGILNNNLDPKIKKKISNISNSINEFILPYKDTVNGIRVFNKDFDISYSHNEDSYSKDFLSDLFYEGKFVAKLIVSVSLDDIVKDIYNSPEYISYDILFDEKGVSIAWSKYPTLFESESHYEESYRLYDEIVAHNDLRKIYNKTDTVGKHFNIHNQSLGKTMIVYHLNNDWYFASIIFDNDVSTADSLLLLLIISTIGIVIISIWVIKDGISSKISRPLSNFMDSMKRVSSGDSSYNENDKSMSKRDDEIGIIFSSFHDLYSNLKVVQSTQRCEY